MGVLCVEHANVLELCYIELLSGDGSSYSILSALPPDTLPCVSLGVYWLLGVWRHVAQVQKDDRKEREDRGHLATTKDWQ